MSDDPELLIDKADGVGTITLNRPRRINALSLGMIEELTGRLTSWADDASVSRVVLRGAGERGFSAGADVRWLRDAVLDDQAAALGFLLAEYRLDALVASFPKPVTAHLVGISMGGGLGLGAHRTYRVGVPATRWAMPEVAIGLWPDVGMCFELSRTPGQVGAHLAMTGDSIDGASALWAGLLDECPGAEASSSSLARAAVWIDECYASDDPVEIVGRLAQHADPAAQEAARTIRSRSPLSVAVALGAVRRAAQLPDVDAVLDQDRALARTTMADPDDFVEGVRAKMVDRDGAPRWRHARLEDVTPTEVEARFGA
ncbi:enoyl-CoA hydratase/isomerase family protein [Brooklawnia cerclae]|uniref:3-hydroxyisobutyryl-CoA hydrolase n=1 Tax=Brooklawnia cerclae TaxID=349934 RepID=A0ABX0SF38_9ACTN|nr:enoyl-CoA hydratase/isomerase family protein [Brooklawnia cerclae]NIH55800.1 enoyl-CoA hydratase [Brooklawnia cerclae]